MQTVLATFDDKQTAQDAVDQLMAQGFSRSSVHLQSGAPAIRSGARESNPGGFMASVTNFFERLFDSDDKADAGTYAEAVRRGGTVVAVDASSDVEVAKAQSVMSKLGTVNLENRAAQWKSRGWKGFDPKSSPMSEGELASERAAVPVVEEKLVVGKRPVDVGGLRVVKRMSETPVSEIITLRQEKATIQRKPVDREATEADFQNFKEGTYEVRETAEEAVVNKKARVVEEVSIGRDVTERDETVSDTVRRTDVEVERIPDKKTSRDKADKVTRRY